AEDGAQAPGDRRHLAIEEAGLQAGEELQRGEQRVHLLAVEPQARQLVARAGARLAEAVAVLLAVVLDRRVEALAHVLEVALHARARHAELLLEGGEGDELALLQELVDLVEALEAVHRVGRLQKTQNQPPVRRRLTAPLSGGRREKRGLSLFSLGAGGEKTWSVPVFSSRRRCRRPAGRRRCGPPWPRGGRRACAAAPGG